MSIKNNNTIRQAIESEHFMDAVVRELTTHKFNGTWKIIHDSLFIENPSNADIDFMKSITDKFEIK
jgi:hypothetical protein